MATGAPDARALGRAINDARTARGWTQPALAARAGVTKGYVSKLEAGRGRRPSAAELGRVLAALDLPALGGTAPDRGPPPPTVRLPAALVLPDRVYRLERRVDALEAIVLRPRQRTPAAPRPARVDAARQRFFRHAAAGR